jgi:ectoine hydroxylase-related dioxygenase (phytanoyl-CoA dioxygenase family)
MTEDEKHRLDTDGYLVIESLMDHALLEQVRVRVDQLFEQEGDSAGSEFKQEPHSRRLANLVDKGEIFERIIQTPRVLECMEHVLGPRFKLSSLNVRSADPDNDWSQPLHADSGATADAQGYWVCNSVWMLDDFTERNGATRLVPGSHCWGVTPQEVVSDLYAPHPREILLTGPAGTVVIMNAHMWHGGTANRTPAHRRAMHVYYTRWDKPQQQYQRRLLRPEVQDRMTPAARRLLALDDPLNDELSAQFSNISGFLK